MEITARDDRLKKRYDLLTIVVALVAGILAIWGGHRYFGGQMRAEEEPEITILTAARDLTAGEPITEDAIATVSYPARAVTEDVAQPKDRVVLVDLPLKVGVKKGNPILRSYVSGAPIDSRLSSRLEPSERAITIAVDPVSGLAGHLKPNDRVDVLGTFRIAAAEAGRGVRAKTLLVAVPVLAVGERTGISFGGDQLPGLSMLATKGRKRANATTVTLKVTHREAEVLALSSETAEIRLVLRHPDDLSRPDAAEEMTLERLLELDPPEPRKKAPERKPAVTYER